ncbi:hypothetical protein F7Q99_29300 [Streptomyces kaniharaensis]|uniref:Outer membrane channel protein CpnT-like N-terminal domain-containing protein n=1 Tax=Streptomyces kaniharaensis TaxID=212423 RepID=A0A6N7L1Z3_9ACTN|nr:hypothetical protein [Streptomyces kaniharaensis]MQS16214.1 hypothetical protein [Streptomyces kaniharaensis]
MSVEMPPALAWVSKLAVGQSWPKGDEDRLRKLGSAWDDAAQELRGISEGMGSSANGVLESISGQVAEEFRAFVTQLESALPEMAESSKQLGKLGRHTGVQIEYSKYMILGQLVLLAGQIAQWAFFAPEVLPAAITSARAAVKKILRRLLISVAAGVALNLGLDAAVQTIQLLKGDRTQWSVDNTVSAAVSGAIGGAVGGVFFGVGGVVVPRFANSLIGKGVFGAATGVTTAGIMLGAFGGEELLGASVLAGAVGAVGGGGRRRFGGKGEKVDVDPVDVDLPDKPVLDLPEAGPPERADAPVPVVGGSGPGGTGGAGGRGASGPAATVADDRPRTSGGPGRDHAGGPPGVVTGRAAAVLPGFGPATADIGRAGGHGAAGTTTRGAGTGGAAAVRQGAVGAATSAGSGRGQGGTGGAAVRASGPQAGGGRAAEGASSGGHAGPAVRTVAGPASATTTAGGPGTGTPAGGAVSAGRTPTGAPEIRTEGSRGVASGASAAEAPSVQAGRPAPAGGRPVTSGGPSAPGAAAGGPARPAAGPSAAEGPRPGDGPATRTESAGGPAAARAESTPRPATATAAATAGSGPEAGVGRAAGPRPVAEEGPGVGPATADPRPPGSRPPVPPARLDPTPRFVVRSGFEARRVAHEGRTVTDLTVRIAFRGGGSGHDLAAIWRRVTEGVEEHYNRPGYRLANGDRLHVTVLRADPGESAHLTVDLVGRDRGMDQRSWWPDAEPVDYAHEVGHQLGLRDEYRTKDLPHRPDGAGSLLGDYRAPAAGGLRQAGLRERHLQLISAAVGDLAAPPAGPHHPSWDRARAAATPHDRGTAWVDPVSDPLKRQGSGPRLHPVGAPAVAPRTHTTPTGSHGTPGGTAAGPGHTGAAAVGGAQPAPPDTSENSLIMQPGYASGDQFGICVSLLHDPGLHVLIARGPAFGTPGHDPVQDKSRAIADFYRSSGIDDSRILFVDVPGMEKHGVWQALKAEAGRIAQQDWGIRKAYRDMYQVKEIWGVTDGTGYVSEVFSQELRGTVRTAWGLTDAHDGRIVDWLAGRGIHLPAGQGRVLVLWSRFTGKATQWNDLRSRMEHDTSFQGIRQIVRDVAGSYDAVIITGDPHPNPAKSDKWDDLVMQLRTELRTDTIHHITGFWKGGSPELTSWGGDTRTGQFLLYDHLDRHHQLDHLGFRSGNLEAVALIGHRVSYLEEEGASGAARMEQWHDKRHGFTRKGGLAPGYERVIVPDPPTASGRYSKQFDVDGYMKGGRAYEPPDEHAWWRKPVEVYGHERGFGLDGLDSIRHQLGLPAVDRDHGAAAFFTDRIQHVARKYETLRNAVVTYGGDSQYLAPYDAYFRTPPEQFQGGPEQLYRAIVHGGLPALPRLWEYYRGLVVQSYLRTAGAQGAFDPQGGASQGAHGAAGGHGATGSGELPPQAPQTDGSGRTDGAARTDGAVREDSATRQDTVAPAAARELYGIPEKNFGKFRRLAQERRLVIDVRPTNTDAPKWLDQGMLPKPKDIKAKTINELDVHLGANREHVGLVGYFEPVPPSHEGLDATTRARLDARYRQRAHEFAELAPVIDRLTAEGRFRVENGLVLGQDGRGEWRAITGDHDVFDISSPGGSRLTPNRYGSVVEEMMANDMAVMHGAHSYWEPQSPFSKGIFDKINASHLPGGEPLLRFRPDADRADLVHAVERPGRPEGPASAGQPGAEGPSAHPGRSAAPPHPVPDALPSAGPESPPSAVPPAHDHASSPGPAPAQRRAFAFTEGSTEPAGAESARVDAFAAALARDVAERAAAGLPLPRLTVTGHGNGTVAGIPHFGRAMAIGRERAEAVAAALVRRLDTHLADRHPGPTAADLEITVRSRGQEPPDGEDAGRATGQTLRQVVVTVEHPTAAADRYAGEVAPRAPAADPHTPTEGTSTAAGGHGTHVIGGHGTPAAGSHPPAEGSGTAAGGHGTPAAGSHPPAEGSGTAAGGHGAPAAGPHPPAEGSGTAADRNATLAADRAAAWNLSREDHDNLKAAIRHGVDEETQTYLFNNGPRPEHAATAIGEHPSWVDERALGRWAVGLKLTPKYETTVALNRLTAAGDGPQGRSLLYLGANSDIEHPLFTTRATEMTLVGVDPKGLNAKTRAAHLEEVVEALERSLGSYAGPGHTVATVKKVEGVVATITVEGPGGPVLTVDYHALTYDEYLEAHPGERFDVVMDKDSWLLDWRPEQAAAEAVTGLLADGGTWVGGTALGPSVEAGFTRTPNDRLGLAGTKWSGYQDLYVRTPSGRAVAEATRLDDLLSSVAKVTETRFKFRDFTFDEDRYREMLAADLEYVLPFHEYFNSSDAAQNTASAIELLPGVAEHLAAEIASFAGRSGDFGARRILADLARLLELDPALVLPPDGAEGGGAAE